RHLRYADVGRIAGAGQTIARSAGAISAAAGPAVRIRGPGAAHCRERDAERRGDSVGRRNPHGTAVMRLVCAAVLALGVLLPASASAALGEGWLPGPGAVGDNTYSGVIDIPR